MAQRADALSRWADGLTLGRLVLVIPITLTAFAGSWGVTTGLLAVDWWSDFLDGKLARRSATSTRLGDWDMAIDTSVGAGLVIGLVLGGHVPWWLGLFGAMLALGAALLDNPALAMLLQALGYGPTLWFAYQEAAPVFWVAAGTIAAIGLFDWKRLVENTLPTFFRGLAGRHDR